MQINNSNILLFLFCFFAIHIAKANNNVSTPIDGPYVFYDGAKVQVKYLNLKNKSLQVKENTYASKSATPELTCGIDKSSRPGFKFKLAAEIKIPPSTYPQPEKLFAISDIEGNFEAFVSTLQANKVIDDRYNWIYGRGHLVINGDSFDRGINVAACIWLMYKLDQEALKKGGRLHFIVGNHEEMNLRGDLRYLKTKYTKVAEKIGKPYIELYGKDTELGRWLRSKNIIERIGSTIFVHGGLSPVLAKSGLTIKEINELGRANFGLPKKEVLTKGEKAALVFDTKFGPMWYRGYFMKKIDESALTIILSKFDATEVVVGHNLVEEVCTYYNNKLIAIDVKHEACMGAKLCNALIITKGQFFKVNAFGKKAAIAEGGEVVVGGKKPTRARTLNKVNPIQRDANILRAVREGSNEKIVKYIGDGNNVNAVYTTRKYTLLHYAIKNGKFEIVKFLIDKDANIEKTYEDQTALMYAIKHQQSKIINFLIAKGANINARNSAKLSPIFFVAQYGTVNNAKLLVGKGALTDIKNANGKSPLDFALAHDNTAVAGFLKTLR